MSSTPGASCHILVIEDNQDILTMIQTILDLGGYHVIGVDGGTSAIQYLQAAPTLPHVILLDLQMPGMNGRAFRSIQRAQPAWAAIPVILMSADSGLAEAQQELGIQAMLRKPFDPAQLLDLVASLCP